MVRNPKVGQRVRVIADKKVVTVVKVHRVDQGPWRIRAVETSPRGFYDFREIEAV
jgi:hypothetical protein